MPRERMSLQQTAREDMSGLVVKSRIAQAISSELLPPPVTCSDPAMTRVYIVKRRGSGKDESSSRFLWTSRFGFQNTRGKSSDSYTPADSCPQLKGRSRPAAHDAINVPILTRSYVAITLNLADLIYVSTVKRFSRRLEGDHQAALSCKR